MVSKFLLEQLDYIYFIYGFTHVLLAVICIIYGRKPIAWKWMARFAIVIALFQWSTLNSLSWESFFFQPFHIVLLIFSFICLFEFARNTMLISGINIPGRWIYFALLIIPLFGISSGTQIVEILVRYFPGFIGSIWVSVSLYFASRKIAYGKPLILASAGMFLYSIAIIAGVHETDFFPGNLLNFEVVWKFIGLPLPLINIFIVLFIFYGVLLYFLQLSRYEPVGLKVEVKKRYLIFLIFILLVVLIIGWIGTEVGGNYGEENMRISLLSRAGMVASAIDYARVKKLTGTINDINSESYKYIKKQFKNIRRQSIDCRFVYLIDIRDGEIIFLVDSESENSSSYSPPGQVYTEAHTEMVKFFSEGKAFIEGPIEDRWGTWVSCITPVRDYETKELIAGFCMDIDVKTWHKIISLNRLPFILITMIISIIVIVAYMLHQKSMDTSAIITAKEKEKIESELNIARDIQMGLIPRVFPPFPDINEMSIFASIEPARVVSGDFYDFFMIGEDKLCFIIGDVSDKGIPASLFMMVTSSLFRSSASGEETPGSILTILNEKLCPKNESLMFVTVFCGILFLKTGLLMYSNGGHNPPYVIRKNKRAMVFGNSTNCVLGVSETELYTDREIILEAGDVFFCYTDGVTEAMKGSELFGEERLMNILSGKEYSCPEDIIHTVGKNIKDFATGYEQSDDITMLSIKYIGCGDK